MSTASKLCFEIKARHMASCMQGSAPGPRGCKLDQPSESEHGLGRRNVGKKIQHTIAAADEAIVHRSTASGEHVLGNCTAFRGGSEDEFRVFDAKGFCIQTRLQVFWLV